MTPRTGRDERIVSRSEYVALRDAYAKASAEQAEAERQRVQMRKARDAHAVYGAKMERHYREAIAERDEVRKHWDEAIKDHERTCERLRAQREQVESAERERDEWHRAALANQQGWQDAQVERDEAIRARLDERERRDHWGERAKAAQVERDRLAEYASHKPNCEFSPSARNPGRCTCGLSAALQEHSDGGQG